MDILFGVIIGVIVLTILVVAHELGHALVARRHGTVVEEFGVGFPPKIWAYKPKNSFLGKNVSFSINALPLGGFVKMQGEHDGDTGKGDYGAMTFWQKTQVLLAGVVANWLFAVVLLTILAVVGLPKVLPDQFAIAGDTTVVRSPVKLVVVTDDMPAAKAGLKVGDEIVSFAGEPIDTPIELSQKTSQLKGQSAEVKYVRDGQERTTTVTLRGDNSDKRGYLGAGPSQQELMRSTWSAPIVGVGTTVQMTVVTLQGVVNVIWNGLTGLAMKVIPNQDVQTRANAQLSAVSESVAGPVGIFGVLFPAAERAGPIYIVFVAALISLALAVMNVLPIPALDGGRWFVTALYRLRNKVLTKEAEEKIHGTGFVVLLALIVLITISDIGKF